MTAGSESFAASAVKVGAITAGAAFSSMQSVRNALGDDWQIAIWIVTFIYGVLQIVKCMPWFFDQTYAFYRVLRYWDWSRVWAIARRSEKPADGGDSK